VQRGRKEGGIMIIVEVEERAIVANEKKEISMGGKEYP